MANDDDNFNYDDAVDEEQTCKVYDGNDVFTAWVQIFLALFALGSLWFKRMREKPRRKFETWFMDVTKQGRRQALDGGLFSLEDGFLSEKENIIG